MRHSTLFGLTLSTLLLSGCATTPEPTFADILGGRVSEYATVKKNWQAGATLQADGEKDIARGNADIKKGEALVKRGNDYVKRGQASIDKGSEQITKAEADYRELVANPAMPELTQ